MCNIRSKRSSIWSSRDKSRFVRSSGLNRPGLSHRLKMDRVGSHRLQFRFNPLHSTLKKLQLDSSLALSDSFPIINNWCLSERCQHLLAFSKNSRQALNTLFEKPSNN